MKRTEFVIPQLLVGSLLLAACGGVGTGSGLGTTSADPSATSSLTASATDSGPSSETAAAPTTTRSAGATEKLLLAKQIQITVGGDGIGPACRVEDPTPGLFDSDPGVWVNDLSGVTEYPGLTVLCLRGFSPSEPIEVVVTAGSFRARTRVTPVVGSPEENTPLGYEEEPATTLFEDGQELKVYTFGDDGVDGPDGALVSEMWEFVPPFAAREALAETGSFTIEAIQGGVQAQLRQPITTPTTRTAFMLSHRSAGDDQLVVLGYPAGSEVPVGLYRRAERYAESASLVKKAGSVTMPRSQVVEFAVTSDLTGSLAPGYYCLLTPEAATEDCPAVTIWADYPGKVSPGDEGDRVKRWQQILIQAGVMSDIPANRDGLYGPATVAALRSWLESRNSTNPDGDRLGRPLYDGLTS